MSVFVRIEGLDPEDVTDQEAHDLADRLFADIHRNYPDLYEDLTGVIPVLNEDEHARLVEVSQIERPTVTDDALASDSDHDPWCDWCQREFGLGGLNWKVETDVVTGWFCSEECADQWGCAADTPERVGRPEIRTDGGHPTDGTEHELERQTWVSEIEVFEVGDNGELIVDRSEARGPVKNEDTLKCSCGREFDAGEDGRALAAEHLRSTRTDTDPEVRTDGGFETRTLRVGPARTVAYGPARANSGEWALRFTSEDGERVVVRLDEDAMYELWTEVHNVPWPSREDDRHDFQREIVARSERADIETLREALDVLGGER